MEIRPSSVNPGTTWTVHVEPNELVTDSGKVLPYGTAIGTVNNKGKINLWRPSATHPRDYAKTAKRMLEDAKRQLEAQGAIKGKPDPDERAAHSRLKRALGGRS